MVTRSTSGHTKQVTESDRLENIVISHNATSRTAAIGTALSAGMVGALVLGVAPDSHAAGVAWQPGGDVGDEASRPATGGFTANEPSNDRVVPVKDFDVTARYGHSGGVHAGRGHDGVDLATPQGRKAFSATRGKVVQAGPAGAYGNLVKIRTSDGKKVLYAHLSSIAVKKGDRIAAGDRIGHVGSTGRSTGAHLHFEVWNKKGKSIDPVKFLGITHKQLVKAGR